MAAAAISGYLLDLPLHSTVESEGWVQDPKPKNVILVVTIAPGGG